MRPAPRVRVAVFIIRIRLWPSYRARHSTASSSGGRRQSAGIATAIEQHVCLGRHDNRRVSKWVHGRIVEVVPLAILEVLAIRSVVAASKAARVVLRQQNTRQQ